MFEGIPIKTTISPRARGTACFIASLGLHVGIIALVTLDSSTSERSDPTKPLVSVQAIKPAATQTQVVFLAPRPPSSQAKPVILSGNAENRAEADDRTKAISDS